MKFAPTILVIVLTATCLVHAAEPPHPVLSEGGGRGDEKLLREFSDEQWFDLIPKQSPRQGVSSPVENVSKHVNDWKWDAKKPNEITCKDSGVMFPNEQYKIKISKVQVLSGKTVEVPYYEGKYGPCLVNARIDFQKFTFLEAKLGTLGMHYAGTKDERYARIVALVLDAWANVLPDYFLSGRGALPITAAEAEKEKWFVARSSDHNELAHEWPHRALAAFDCIYDSQALKDLSVKRGYDVRAHIAKDLFGNIGDMFVKHVKPEWAIRSNLSLPYMVMADAATILNRPDFITYLDQYMEAALSDNLMRDGMFPESFGYGRGYTTVTLAALERMEKYFSIRPANAPELRAIFAKCEPRRAFLKRCVSCEYPLCYPNGMLPPFGDTPNFAEAEAKRDSSLSAILPSYGFVALAAGSGAQQTQLDIAFNDFANHCHADVLGMTLFAFGEEIIGNTRYARVPGRPFNNSTLGQNTVVIDRQDQNRREVAGRLSNGGSLTWYEPGVGGVAVAEVDGSRAYIGKCSRYQRLMLLNTVDTAHPYVIDCFAVEGGKQHDYVLHGAFTFEQSAKISFPLIPMSDPYPLLVPGEKWKEPKQMEDGFPIYGMIRNVSSARSPGSWDATFTGVKQPQGTRAFMLDDGTNHVFLGKSPILGAQKNGLQWRPSLIVRRESSDKEALRSVFISLIEPLNGTSAIVGIERLPVKQGNADAVALRVKFVDGREDFVLINLNNSNVTGCAEKSQPIETRDGEFSLEGRAGVHIRTKGFERTIALAATRFTAGKKALNLHETYTGSIQAILRHEEGGAANAFIADSEALPAGDALKGHWMNVIFGTYEAAPDGKGSFPLGIKEQKDISQQFQIDHIEQTNGQTKIILAEDPYLTLKNNVLTENLRPHRTFKGPVSFQIFLSQSVP